MEFGPPKPEEDEDEETVEDFSVERNNWMLFSDRLRSLFSPEEEDDDDDEVDPKKKRSKKLVGLFRRHNFATKAVKEAALSEGLEADQSIETNAPTDIIEAEPPQILSDEFEIVSRDIKDEADNVIIEQSVIDLAGTEISRTTSVDIELPSTLSSPEGSIDDISVSFEANLSEQSLVPSNGAETKSSIPESKSPNVAPIIVGSLIVDRLSRNADKRISDQAEKLRERIEKLENEYAVDEIEHTEADKKSKLEQEKMRLQIDKLRAEKVIKNFERPKQVEKETHKKATPFDIEARSDAKIPTEISSLDIEQIIGSVSPSELPNARVERGVAKEIYDERQFEIRDEASIPDVDSKRASSSHGPGNVYQQQSMKDIALIKESLENSKGLIDQSEIDNSQTMRTAILTGAVTALVIIAGFIVMSWML